MSTADELLRPISARSAILNILMSADQESLTSREICTATTSVGYAEATARVAASRMVTAGDMVRGDRAYSLSPRLLERRRRLEAAMSPATREWTGDWETVVITATGRSAADRAAQRTQLVELGLAELREGVWMRPDNLDHAWPDDLASVARRMRVRPLEDAAELAAELWDLEGWAARGRALLDAIDAAETAADRSAGFAAVVTGVRHLTSDPLLPTELLPQDWPSARLRTAYDDFRGWLLGA